MHMLEHNRATQYAKIATSEHFFTYGPPRACTVSKYCAASTWVESLVLGALS